MIEAQPPVPNNKINIFELTANALPFFAGIVLVCEAIPLVLYYSRFNIGIIPFISFQDLFKSFLSQAIVYAIISMFFGFIYLLKDKDFRSRLIGKKWRAVVFIVLNITLIQLYYSFIGSMQSTIIIAFYMVGFNIVSTLGSYLWTKDIVTNIFLTKRIFYNCLIMASVLIIGYETYSKQMRANILKKNIGSHSISLILENDTIKPYQKRYVIGQTSDFYFIVDDSVSIIIKAENVKQIKIYESIPSKTL